MGAAKRRIACAYCNRSAIRKWSALYCSDQCSMSARQMKRRNRELYDQTVAVRLSKAIQARDALIPMVQAGNKLSRRIWLNTWARENYKAQKRGQKLPPARPTHESS